MRPCLQQGSELRLTKGLRDGHGGGREARQLEEKLKTREYGDAVVKDQQVGLLGDRDAKRVGAAVDLRDHLPAVPSVLRLEFAR